MLEIIKKAQEFLAAALAHQQKQINSIFLSTFEVFQMAKMLSFTQGILVSPLVSRTFLAYENSIITQILTKFEGFVEMS